jgi:hypothetical protein
VEKIFLKPSFREVLHKGSEPDVFFDILSYSGSTTQEKNLGSVIVLSYLRQKDDDLSYIVSLVSSLAKREFYSPQSISEQDARTAFERTLKKLNEILVEYFEKKDFTLNLGLAAISGDNLYISRLGKFKVALARNEEYIDILNNVNLFSKDDVQEHQFDNIISGKLKANDKMFCYFPVRTMSSREKVLNPLFVSEKQNDFCKKIDSFAVNSPNFACCGIHININQTKEIPVELNLPSIETPKVELASLSETLDGDISDKSDAPSIPSKETHRKFVDVEPAIDPAPTNVIRAEMSVAKRNNIFASIVSKMFSFSFLKRKHRYAVIGRTKNNNYRWVMLGLIIVAVGIGGWMIVKNSGNSVETDLVARANEFLQSARSRLTQNNSRDARVILYQALASISGATGKNISAVRDELSKTLNIIDQVSEKKPEQILNFSENNPGIFLVASSGSTIYAVGNSNLLLSVNAGKVSELGQISFAPKYISADNSFVSVFDGNSKVMAYDIKKNKLSEYILKDPAESIDSSFFMNNLYILSGKEIVKYADVTTGNVKRTSWGNVETDDNLNSFSIDGNIYALSTNGAIIDMLKGKKQSEYSLSVTPKNDSKLYTSKDLPFLYLSVISDNRVYVFDKTSGSLKVTYDLSSIGDTNSIAISSDGTIIISAASSLWQIKP